MSGSPQKVVPKWHHPSEVMVLHKLKQRKKKLQARISGNRLTISTNQNAKVSFFDNVFSAKKRKNPFLKNSVAKRNKTEPSSPISLDESTDQTLFKLLHQGIPSTSANISVTSFNNVLTKLNSVEVKQEVVEVVKAQGKTWLPIDWSLKNRVRLLSANPFDWKQKLKISEEASGITGFTRCLDKNTETTLDISPNAKFYQCCLYWQQPCLPWLNLFPRSVQKMENNTAINSDIKQSLQHAWSDSLTSVFHLLRTRQCPYFYACANNFTVLFRAASICGFSNMHALIAPTTRGFRQLLKNEAIEFTMPLRRKRVSDQGYETWDSAIDNVHEGAEDEENDSWLKSLGVDDDDIKKINYTQEKIFHKSECDVDNGEESLVVLEGIEVQALYNFLLNNSKCTTSLTGHLAGIPPTILAPVAFRGASLNSLKVRESQVNQDGSDYYSLELLGPILPNMIHNLFAINPPQHSMTATFTNISTTESFSKVTSSERHSDIESKGSIVFGEENLSDCGLFPKVLKHFCAPDKDHVTTVECLKYDDENKTYTWS